jgi:mono/diheme cytochrome c family protein
MMRRFAAFALCVALSVLPNAAAAPQADKPAAGSAGKTEAPAAPPGPQASPSDIDGQQMFATLCGFCHEAGGRKAGKAPKLAGNPHTDEYLIERIKKGKPGAMPAFGKVFSEGQIYAILAYIRGLEE